MSVSAKNLQTVLPVTDSNTIRPIKDRSEGNPLVQFLDQGAATPGALPTAARGDGRDFLAFYGLAQNPFADSVNPAFFYKTEAHRDACARLLMAIENDVSLAMLTGVSGTGKTLITQLILEQLDTARYEPVLVLVTPGMRRTGLLREILSEMSVALPVGINRTSDLLKMLSNAIMDLHSEGRKLVLLIDECHFLDADALHIVRTISNVEIPERKLTTCLLVGEARFAKRLERPGYESLRNRMFFRSELPPMTAEACAQYIKFRTMVAQRPSDLFAADALPMVHALTGGVCRSVNKLCMLALIEGCICQQPRIDRAVVEACGAQL